MTKAQEFRDLSIEELEANCGDLQRTFCTSQRTKAK